MRVVPVKKKHKHIVTNFEFFLSDESTQTYLTQA